MLLEKGRVSLVSSFKKKKKVRREKRGRKEREENNLEIVAGQGDFSNVLAHKVYSRGVN